MGKSSGALATSTGTSSNGWSDFAFKYPSFMKLAVVLIWLLGLFFAFLSLRAAAFGNAVGQDTHAYWLAAQGDLVYGRAPGQRDAYLYSPAFLAIIRPLAVIPWPAFLLMWVCLEAAVLLWLLKPLQLRWSIPTFLLCLPELVVGNIYILLAAAAVLGLKKPVVWSFPILTKVTAGVGLLWFAARGEWRRLLQGAGGTALIVVASYALDPAGWQAWLQFLIEHREGTPDSRTSFLLRCLLAIALVVIGARKQWPLLIAPAMILASPVLVGTIPWTILAAVPRLSGMARKEAVAGAEAASPAAAYR